VAWIPRNHICSLEIVHPNSYTTFLFGKNVDNGTEL
jgi:hypothetical protein